MIRLCFVLIFVVTELVFSQGTGIQLIYDSGNYGIGLCNSIKLNNSGIKQLYIQHGLYNISSGTNASGRYMLLNKSTGNWFVPHNGFINASWGVSYPSGIYDCSPVSIFAVSPIDTNKLIKYVVTPSAECPDARTFYTTNGGANFMQGNFNCGGILIFPAGIDYNPKTVSTLLYGYRTFSGPYEYGIYKSTNYGINWVLTSSLDSLRECPGAYGWSPYHKYGFLKYNPFDTAIVYANAITSVYISTNCGANFFRGNVKWFRYIVFSYKDSIVYGFNDGKIYRSSDKGLSWDSAVTARNFKALEINPDLPNILYAGDSLGVYRSTNYGNNWELYNNTFTPTKEVIGISKDTGSLDTFFVVTKKSVYKVWASFLVGIKKEINIIPEEYSLEQNYPNPFNSMTNLKFKMLNAGNTEIKVFDIAGKEVDILVNEYLHAGTYEVRFDSGDLPSGIYFYRMQSGRYTETKRMILIK
jgi:hypothetical protein